MIFYNGARPHGGRGWKLPIATLTAIAAASGVAGCSSSPAPATACQQMRAALTIAVTDQAMQDQAGHERWITGGDRGALVFLATHTQRAPVLHEAAMAYLLNKPRNAPQWLPQYNTLRSALRQQGEACHIPGAGALPVSNPWKHPPRPPKFPVGHKPEPSHVLDRLPATPDATCPKLGVVKDYFTPADHKRDVLTCQKKLTSDGIEQVWQITGH